MGNASFNSDGIDGLPPIIVGPVGCPWIVVGTCRTSEERTEFRCKKYVFPGIDGAGRQNFGLVVPEIIWDLEIETYSLAYLLHFEAQFAHYRPGDVRPIQVEQEGPGGGGGEGEGGEGHEDPPDPPEGSAITRRSVYALKSETGRVWQNVAFVKYQRLKLYKVFGSPTHGGPPEEHFLRVARVTWRWMQQSIRA